MGAFVKQIVLPYLDDSNEVIRRAAAKAGSLLYVKYSDNPSYLPSKTQQFQTRANSPV